MIAQSNKEQTNIQTGMSKCLYQNLIGYQIFCEINSYVT